MKQAVKRLSWRPLGILCSSLVWLPLVAEVAIALPPPEDQPEEVLRSQIITAARSPLDGQPLTPAEYAQLELALQADAEPPPELSPNVRRLINLLKLRKFIKTVFPFIPIK
jgi:hypothetical protein